MKTTTYKNGKSTFKSYFKPIGSGYEVGFRSGTKTLFLGNFVNPTEARRWYALMNREIRTFSKRFKVGPKYPSQFFNGFISHHLYTKYYNFVSKLTSKHWRKHLQATNKSTRKYKQLKRHWPSSPRRPLLKRAA